MINSIKKNSRQYHILTITLFNFSCSCASSGNWWKSNTVCSYRLWYASYLPVSTFKSVARSKSCMKLNTVDGTWISEFILVPLAFYGSSDHVHWPTTFPLFWFGPFLFSGVRDHPSTPKLYLRKEIYVAVYKATIKIMLCKHKWG